MAVFPHIPPFVVYCAVVPTHNYVFCLACMSRASDVEDDEDGKRGTGTRGAKGGAKRFNIAGVNGMDELGQDIMFCFVFFVFSHGAASIDLDRAFFPCFACFSWLVTRQCLGSFSLLCITTC